MHVFAAEGAVGAVPSRLKGLPGRTGRDEGVATRADQVLAARLFQGFADVEIILRLEILHQSPLQLTVAKVLAT